MRFHALLLQSVSEDVIEQNAAKSKAQRSRVPELYELHATLCDREMCFGTSVADDR
jgi:hypothetical protein